MLRRSPPSPRGRRRGWRHSDCKITGVTGTGDDKTRKMMVATGIPSRSFHLILLSALSYHSSTPWSDFLDWVMTCMHAASTNRRNRLATLLMLTGNTDLAVRVWIGESTVLACIDSCDFFKSASSVPIHPTYPCHGTDSCGPNLPLRRSYSLL